MLHKKYHIQSHFSGVLEDDFIITEQTGETTLTSTPSHLNYGIIGICTNGNATIHLYNKKHIWVKDELIILLPHQLCALDNESADFTACYIVLPQTLYSDILSYFRHFDANFHFFMQDHFHYDLKLDDGIERFQIYLGLLKDRRKRSNTEELLREKIICLLSIIYMELYDYYLNVRKIQPFNTTLRKEQLVYDFCNLVSTHHSEHRDVKFYADRLNITTTYLTSIIKDKSGISAKQYLSTYIILEIKSLLRDSRLNIQQIAILANFPTQSALNRFFRQYTGMTLTMYRKNIYQI